MDRPKEIVRTTLDKCFDGMTELPQCGVYILAYLGKIIYVGKSWDLSDRMRHHLKVGDYPIDNWLREMVFDFKNIRLDFLLTPNDVDYEYWNKEVEARAITKFRPLFNDVLN